MVTKAATYVPFPTFIDSTIRSAFVSCETKGFRSYFQHWKSKRISHHLSAGSAFAHGIEVARKLYYSRDDVVSSLLPSSPSARADVSVAAGALAAFFARPLEDSPEEADGAKSADRILDAVIKYFREWPLETDPIVPYVNPHGVPAVEYRFALPIDVEHPETGEPLIYSGRFDMLAQYDGFWPVDEKTASRLGQTWAQQFDLRGQFLGYCWAVREQGYQPRGVIARGIGFLKNETTFQQVPVRYPPWLLDEWYEQLVLDVNRMKLAWYNQRYSKAFGEACAEYGGCQFKPICTRPNPDEWLSNLFQVLPWNPLEDHEHPATDFIMETTLHGKCEELMGLADQSG